jgi:hypothetical protein
VINRNDVAAALQADAKSFQDEVANLDADALYTRILASLGLTGDNHTYANDRLAPGVWPKNVDRRGHFQIVGTNRRSIVVSDMHGLIDIGGVHVDDPQVLAEAARRLMLLAQRMADRQEQ